MEHIHALIAKHEEKIQQIEGQIQQSIMNHNTLQGYLIATKEALVAAQAIIDSLAPHSVLSDACHAAQEIVEAVEEVAEVVEQLIEG
jgi:hypothetical protein